MLRAFTSIFTPSGDPIVGGTGTPGTVPLWITASKIGDSGITDNGATLTFVSRNLASSAAQTWTLASSTSALNIQSGLFNIDTASAGGRIGFGTITPGSFVDVQSSDLGPTGTGRSQLRLLYTGTATANEGGSIAFGGVQTNPSQYTQYSYIKGGKDDSVSGNYGGHLQFWTRPNGGVYAERVRIASTGNLILGSGEASATPVGNTFRAPSGAGTDIAGGTLTIAGGASTGTGAGGSILFQTAPAGTTGSVANALATRLTVSNNGGVAIGSGSATANALTFNAGRYAIWDESQTKIGDDGTIRALAASGDTGISYYTTKSLKIRSGLTLVATFDAVGNIYGTSGTTGMTDGFFYIPAAAGAPSGTPTAVSGRVPMYYDTTNNKFYIYNGAWKAVTLA